MTSVTTQAHKQTPEAKHHDISISISPGGLPHGGDQPLHLIGKKRGGKGYGSLIKQGKARENLAGGENVCHFLPEIAHDSVTALGCCSRMERQVEQIIGLEAELMRILVVLGTGG